MTASRKDIEHRVETFVRFCREKGMKVTHQRMEIFRELAGSTDHPDAERIFASVRKRVAGISRDTVYRTLATLEDGGLIHRACAVSGPTRFDPNTDPHHHFVCTVCGSIKDFVSDKLADLPIPKSISKFGRVECSQVQVRGVCSDCLGKKAKDR